MLTTITVTMCLLAGAPGYADDPDRDCETFDLPVLDMSAQQCAVLGEHAILEWISANDPEHYFEFHRLARWSCAAGVRA